MIAYLTNYLSMVLAAVPFLILLMLTRFFDAKKCEKVKPLRFIAVGFLGWQLIQSAFLVELDIWVYLIRMVDPFFIVFLLFGLSFMDEGEEEHPRIQRFRIHAAIILSINAILQTAFLVNFPDYSFLSILSVFVIMASLSKLFMKVSLHTLIRYRVCVGTWLLTALSPLPFFHLPFLIVMGWVFYRRFRRGFLDSDSRMELLENEKETVGFLMEELSGNIRDVSDLKASLRIFLRGLLSAVEGKAAAIYLWDDDRKLYYAEMLEGYYFPLNRTGVNMFARLQSLHESVYVQTIEDHSNLVYRCGKLQEAMFFPFAGSHPEVGLAGIGTGTIQSLILSPILLNGKTLGVLVVQNKEYERYLSDGDFSVVQNFSHHAAMMINSARLMEEKAERQRVDHELAVGYRIQADLLPSKIPEYEGIELAGSMKPAKEIGGDYYDFIELSQERLAIVMGDVSGKGVPAGMVMTMVHTLLHSLYPYAEDGKELLVRVNAAMADHVKSSMFITMLYFIWDASSKTLRYTGCGHEHILIYRKDKEVLEAVRSGGLALGMTDDVSMLLQEKELEVNPGDTIVLYTDGIVEARDVKGDMYGFDRLKRFVENNHGLEVETLRKTLVQDVQRFAQGVPQSDDITCMVMRFS